MAKGAGTERAGVRVERWHRPAGIVGSQRGEGGQRLRLPHRPQPPPHTAARPRLPLLQPGQHTHVPEEHQRERDVDDRRPSGLGHVEQAAQSGDLLGCGASLGGRTWPGAARGPGVGRRTSADTLAEGRQVARIERRVAKMAENGGVAPHPGLAVIRLVEDRVDRAPPGHEHQRRDQKRPHQHRDGYQAQGIESDRGRVDRREHQAGGAEPAVPRQPRVAFGPAEEGVFGRLWRDGRGPGPGGRGPVARSGNGRQPRLRREAVPEVERPGHLADRILAQGDRVRVRAPEQPLLQRSPTRGRPAHAGEVQ